MIISNKAKDGGEGRVHRNKMAGEEEQLDKEQIMINQQHVYSKLSSSLPHFPSVHHLISVTSH